MIVFRFIVGQRTRVAARALALMATALLANSCSLDVEPIPPTATDGHVGLDFDIVNGASKAGVVKILPAAGYYINELRFQVRQEAFPVPEVIDWLAAESEMSTVDWHGISTVAAETVRERNGTYTETHGLLNAAWMGVDPEFEVSFYDGGGNRVAGPIAARGEEYVHARQTGIEWIEGEPKPGDYGGNKGSYSALTVTSGGDFTGAKNDIYNVVVTTGGPVGGGAVVSVTSLRGDDVEAYGVVSGVPIDLGAGGAQITFTDAGSTELVEGDHWVVRCTAGNAQAEIDPEVLAVEPGLKANFSAIAEIRLQFPHSRDIEWFTLPMTTAEARVKWARGPDTPYVIPIEMEEKQAGAPGYGLDVRISVNGTENPARDAKVYSPGDTINVAVNLYDNDGVRINPEGELPTYRQMVTGQSNGIMYYDLNNDPSLGFFTENRLNLMRLAIYGPVQNVEQNYTEEEPEDYFIEEVNLPDVSGVILAGFGPPPTTWDDPIPNSADFELPEDAEPGTYIVLAKTARSYKGERRYREAHLEIQVGTAEQTHFDEEVGNCEVCHTDEARLDRLRHGISIASPKFCEPCHVPPHNEPVAVTVHRIHFNSSKYPVRKSGCSLCHLKRDSNTRASIAVCGACHGTIHPGEDLEFDPDPYARCGQTCHKVLPEIHVIGVTY